MYAIQKVHRCALVVGVLLTLLLSLLTALFAPAHAAPLHQQGMTPAEQCAEGLTLSNSGKHEEALPYLEAGFARREEGDFPGYVELSGCAKALGDARRIVHSDFSGSIEAHEIARTFIQQAGDEFAPLEGQIILSIGLNYASMGIYDEALDTYEQARPLIKQTGGIDHYVGLLVSIAQVHIERGYAEEALLELQSARDELQAHENRPDNPIHPYTRMTIYETSGKAYHSLGQYPEALEQHQRVLDIADDPETLSHPLITQGRTATLSSIGTVYSTQGRFEQALEMYRGSLEEAEQELARAIALAGMGNVYLQKGDYELGIQSLEDALEIVRGLDSRTPLYEATMLNSLSGAYVIQGHYARALEYALHARQISRSFGIKSSEIAALATIGSVYEAQGRYDDAIASIQAALQIIDAIGGEYYLKAPILRNLGVLYGITGAYEQAIETLSQTLELQQQIGQQEDIPHALHSLGMTHAELENYEEALRFLQQAIALNQDETRNLFGTGADLYGIGYVYSRQERYDEALNHFEQALTIQRKVGDRANEGVTLGSIGRLYEDQNQPVQALDYYEQAMEVFEDVRATAGSEQARASFIAEQSPLYDRAITLYSQESQDEQAFHTSERGRARTFLDSLATGYVQLADNDANELLKQEQALYVERQTTQNALARARAADPPDDTLVADLEANLSQLEADYAAVQEVIAGRGDQLAALVPGRSAVPELADIQAALDADTTLLSYWVTEEQAFAFVVTQDALEVIALAATRDDLFDLVEGLRRFSDLGEAQPAVAGTLHQILIEPLREHLTTPHLAIIPHDVLHYLPFAALSDGEQFLVDTYTLTLLPSASSLLHIQQNMGNQLTDPLILGNPATNTPNLSSLPFAEQEAETIADLYGSTPLLGNAATEEQIHDGTAEAGILHLAVHGEFDVHLPLSSTLYLSPDDHHDGTLQVSEIYSLPLTRTDLVVLSACETQIDDTSIVHGQMSVDAGDELVGMTRAFFYAGTPSVVSTLWQVDDESSALLMERFYIHLRNGMSKAEALRQAQIDVRQEHPNPHYWAGYVLSGDPGEPVAYSSVPWLIGGALLVLLLLAGLRIWIFIRQRKAA